MDEILPVIPESRTSMMANPLGVLVERRRAERASRLMRGRFAIVIEVMALAMSAYSLLRG